jgi:hypothetical protein
VKDVSGDGHLDLLSWQDLGGTAGHGTYRLAITGKGSARQVFRRENDTDDETVGRVPARWSSRSGPGEALRRFRA